MLLLTGEQHHIISCCLFNTLSLFILFFNYLSTALPYSDTTTKAKGDSKDFWVNMPNLISHLKKVADQKPQATYYNVDMLKYQVNVAI